MSLLFGFLSPLVKEEQPATHKAEPFISGLQSDVPEGVVVGISWHKDGDVV
jgi:hypothetical protein